MDNTKSLSKFKALVEKDLTSLAKSWSYLPGHHQSLIVETLLLEQSNRTISEWSKRSDNWPVVYRLVALLERWSSYDMPDLATVKDVLGRYESVKGSPISCTEKVAFCYLAGKGCTTEGASLLGYPIREVRQGSSSSRSKLLTWFLTEEGHSSWVRLIADTPLHRTAWRVMDERLEKPRKTYSCEQFESMCSEVFLGGTRSGTVRVKFLRDERDFVSSFIARHGRLEARRIRGNMTRVQAYVLDRFLSSTPEMESSIPRALRAEVRAAAKDVCLVLSGWVGKQQTPPSHLPAWQQVYYRFNSTEETMEYLRYKAKAGRRPIVSTDRLLFKPIGDYQARTSLLVSNGGIVPDRFHMVSNSYLSKGVRSLRGARAPEMREVVSSRQAMSLRQRAGTRATYPSCSGITSDDLKKHGSLLSDRDVVLVHEVLLQGKGQAEVARSLGVTQGAVSHRLAVAVEKIHLAKDLMPLPGYQAYEEIGKHLYPGDEGRYTSIALLLSTHAASNGKQTETARRLGIGQPSVSQRFGKAADKIIAEGCSWSLSEEGRKACKVVSTLRNIPYAFQSLVSRFKWDQRALQRKVKAHKVSITKV